MRFNTRRLLLVTTTLALICGYFGWQRRQERINYERYDAPGPVAERVYWPTPVRELVRRIEDASAAARDAQVYRLFNERRYGYTDCYLRLQMEADEYNELIHELELQPTGGASRAARRFFARAPAGWSLPNVGPERVLHRTAGRGGFQYGVVVTTLYDEPAGTLNARVTNDF